MMLLIDRRTFFAGAVAVGASAAVPRAFAQAPAGPFKLDPLPCAAAKAGTLTV